MSHVVEINKKCDATIYGSIRKGTISFILDLLQVRCFKNNTIFIYNISPANLLSSMISKFYSCEIIYHLHDPFPHSGVMNPLIYLLQFVQICFSDKILVFDETLINDTKRLYLTGNKSFCTVKHGLPSFRYVDSGVSKDKICYGFFGRNMPYKNVERFITLSKKFPESNFYILGEGYDNIYPVPGNLKIKTGYIDNDEYYSAMLDVYYVVIPYKDISFSGVISDSVALEKAMIVSRQVENIYSNSNMSLLDEFITEKKSSPKEISRDAGWKEVF